MLENSMHDDPNKRPALVVASVASFLTPLWDPR
jgi:hypothetical protein